MLCVDWKCSVRKVNLIRNKYSWHFVFVISLAETKSDIFKQEMVFTLVTCNIITRLNFSPHLSSVEVFILNKFHDHLSANEETGAQQSA